MADLHPRGPAHPMLPSPTPHGKLLAQSPPPTAALTRTRTPSLSEHLCGVSTVVPCACRQRTYSQAALFPTLGVGLLDFKLNSSPRPELFSGVPSPRVSLECPTQSLAGVPNPRVSPECPAQSLSGVPNPRVSLSAQPTKRGWGYSK